MATKSQQPTRDLLLGEAVRGAREQKGLAVSELAAGTGVPEARIAAREEERLDSDFELLLTLADGMGVRLSTFVLRVEELKSGLV